MMQAIILCGGQGTRLRSVIGEKQKTMTKVGAVPFLVNVVNYLKSYKITNVIFATGYKSHEVRDYFGEKYYFGIDVSYSEEKTPLGTGGAIRNALPYIKYDYVLVLNGDTLFKANLKNLEKAFLSSNADMSIICKEVDDRSRYGSIRLDFNNEKVKGNNNDFGIITSFDEKKSDSDKKEEELYINGGIYILKKKLIEEIPSNEKLSLEKDLIPRWISENKTITGIISDESFIDIGTPESLEEYKDRVNNEGEEIEK